MNFRLLPLKKPILFACLSVLIASNLLAQPFISSISNLKADIGSNIVIRGGGFSSSLSGNIVLFNGIKATVTSATVDSLIVIVPNGASYGAITVTTQNMVAISPLPFSITFRGCPSLNAASFLPKSSIASGNGAANSIAGDIDLDGSPDVVSINNSSNTMSVLRNNGKAGKLAFSVAIDFTTGNLPQKLLMSDLNGDAKPEIIIWNTFSSSISVFKNLSTPGTVSFAPAVDFTTGYYPTDIATGDVDADGKIDVVIANNYSYMVSILKNQSTTATIAFAAKTDLRTGFLKPKKIALADMNSDAKADIVLLSTNNNSADSVSIFANTSTTGNLTFAPRINFTSGYNTFDLAIGDIDGNNLPDLVIGNGSSNKIIVLPHANTPGAIAFASPVDISALNATQTIAINDFDGDGRPDISTLNLNAVSIYRNMGTGGSITFAPQIDVNVGSYSGNFAVADFDRNGKPDFVVSASFDNSVSIIRTKTSQKVFLVDSAKTGNQTAIGLCSVSTADWVNACNNLQTAITAAQEGDQVWVSKGTYFPSEDSAGSNSDRRNMTFVMKNGVQVYGGFSGTETSVSQLNSAANETILSGRITTGGTPVNVNTIVWFREIENITLLQGFTIKNGKALNAGFGGGISLDASSPQISNCIISGNSSNNSGGGVYLNNSFPTFINCNISNNSAPAGAGISANNSSPYIINCTIVKNTGSNNGGGLYNAGGSANITNSIIWGNNNSNNTTDNIFSSSGTVTVTYSIVGQATGVYPGSGNKNGNPLFVEGSKENFSLIKGSFAVAAGSVNAYPAAAPTTDLTGNQRTTNGTISLGAYQGGNNPVTNPSQRVFVNRTQTDLFASGFSWTAAYSNLSDAMAVANNNDIKTVWVAKGSYKPSLDSSGNPNPGSTNNLTFPMKRGFSFYGGFAGNETNISQRVSGANETILDGDNISSWMVYVSNPDANNLIDGFTLVNSGYDYTIGGGAIFLQYSNASVSNCRLINNDQGIQNWYGKLKINNCYFSGNRNRGLYGGAINNYAAVANITDCNFYENVPIGNYAFGGALQNYSSSVNILRCKFEKNRAIHAGGAIYNDNNAVVTISECKFIANEAANGKRGWYGGSGGAIYSNNSRTLFVNCTFLKNEAGAGGTIANRSSVTNYVNCTITNNSGAYCGGIYSVLNSKDTITNSIVWGNQSELDNNENLYNYETYNEAGFNVDHSIVGLTAGVYPGAGNLNTNPMFVDTASENLKLMSASPAIDAGDNTAYPGNLNSDVDIDGYPRLTRAKIDMGATEYNAILSVKWISFSAQKLNESGLLKWEVVNEPNNDHFEVEVSADGRTFRVIGKVAASNHNTYSFTDVDLEGYAGSVIYYRIKQVDKTGAFSYSEIEKIVNRGNGFACRLIENPVKGNVIKIKIQSVANDKGVLKVFDVNGKQLLANHLVWSTGSSLHSIGTLPLAHGAYTVILTTGSGQYVLKFVK